VNAPTTLDAYIAAFPPDTQTRLNQLRAMIRQVAPEAVESISYGMPTFKLHGAPLVYVGAFKAHIGLYALPTSHAAFREAFSRYKSGKGSVQFPLREPLPLELITRVVEFRKEEIARSLTANP
jgi:uncharacterized protein YdhG (YjbR/CyaY superfamily)